jgi:hypothetical protein
MQPTQQPTPAAPVRKPWRRPTLKTIAVSLDTASSVGSSLDGSNPTGPN